MAAGKKQFQRYACRFLITFHYNKTPKMHIITNSQLYTVFEACKRYIRYIKRIARRPKIGFQRNVGIGVIWPRQGWQSTLCRLAPDHWQSYYRYFAMCFVLHNGLSVVSSTKGFPVVFYLLYQNRVLHEIPSIYKHLKLLHSNGSCPHSKTLTAQYQKTIQPLPKSKHRALRTCDDF